jgi:hypothetical protein
MVNNGDLHQKSIPIARVLMHENPRCISHQLHEEAREHGPHEVPRLVPDALDELPNETA